MSTDNDYRRGRHCVFAMHVYLVFVTKYRRRVFTKAMMDDMHDIFASVCADFEVELVEMDGEDDHVHLLVNYPPYLRPERRSLRAGTKGSSIFIAAPLLLFLGEKRLRD